jgi:hypothetical protein
MKIQIVHTRAACSTAILYELDDFSVSKEDFRATLKTKMPDLFNRTYTVSQLSFVVASTLPHQRDAIELLGAVGFQNLGTEYNSKNNTSPTFWFIAAKDYVKGVQEVTKNLPQEGQS